MAVDVSKLVQKAHNAVDRRNYGLAIINYMQALTLQPENIDAREKLRACQMRAYTESGISPFVATLKALPAFIKATFLGMFGKHEQAVLQAENALTAKPDFVPAMKRLSNSAIEMEWHEVSCWQMLEIIHKHDNEDVDTMYDLVEELSEIGRIDEAIALCDDIRELDPSGDIDSLTRELAANKTADIFEVGATKGARHILKNTEGARDLEDATQIARNDAMRERKVAALQKQFDDRPDDYRLLLRIGDEWYNFEDFKRGYQEAKKVFVQAQEMAPADHNIKVKLGDLEIKRLRLNVLAWQKKAKEGDEEAKKKYQDAVKKLVTFQIKEFEERVHAQPLIAAYHFELGKLYLQTKQYDKAVAEFQHSCRDPKLAIESYTNMGLCFMGMDQYDLAIDMLKRGTEGSEVFSKVKDAVYFLADAYEQDGQLEKALEQFNRVFEDDITYKDVRSRVDSLRKIFKDKKKEEAE